MGMKRTFLVKGDERIEIKQDFDFQTAKLLGYTLEEVKDRREWYMRRELIDSKGESFVYSQPSDKYNIRVVELREGERVLSREDIEMAWNSEPVQNHISFTSHESNFFRSLCKQLGFPECDS